MSARPKGVRVSAFPLEISSQLNSSSYLASDSCDAAYAAGLTFASALRDLMANNTSWARVELYYSCFYSMRALLLMDEIISFHCGEYLLCDFKDGSVKKGGSSSHNWSWSSIRDFKRLNGWYYSQDSTDAYDLMREIREDANYRFGFMDPNWPSCFSEVANSTLNKFYRNYRDDDAFFYTYLDSHFALAYPTKLVKSVEEKLNVKNYLISDERKLHIKKIWPFKDKAPFQ